MEEEEEDGQWGGNFRDEELELSMAGRMLS